MFQIPYAISCIVLETTVKYTQDQNVQQKVERNGSSRETRDHPEGSSGDGTNTYASINPVSHVDAHAQGDDGDSDQPRHSQRENGHQMEEPEDSDDSAGPSRPLLKGSHAGTIKSSSGDNQRLNIVFTLYWTFTSTFLGVLALFWVDFIPGFGMQRDVHQFLPQYVYILLHKVTIISQFVYICLLHNTLVWL